MCPEIGWIAVETFSAWSPAYAPYDRLFICQNKPHIGPDCTSLAGRLTYHIPRQRPIGPAILFAVTTVAAGGDALASDDAPGVSQPRGFSVSEAALAVEATTPDSQQLIAGSRGAPTGTGVEREMLGRFGLRVAATIRAN